MTAPFVWGNNGPASPEQIDAERKVAEALMSTNPNPQTMWQGIEAASGRIGGSLLNWKAGSDQKAGQEDYTRQLAALGENPSRSALETVAGNGFANPGQDAVVHALLAQNLAQSDPNQRLDLELKQAQIDAARAKPGLSEPPKYRLNPDGTESAISGGEADPANPLNVNKVIGAASDGTPLGTTGNAAIDPTIDGYSTKSGPGGLTQAAIDQRALSYLTGGTTPPIGRTGAAGAQSAAISNRMAEIDPSGNLAKNKTVLRSLSSSLTQQTQYLNNTERAFNTANDTLASLQTYMTKNGINSSQFPDFNSFSNFLKAHGQDPGAAGGYNAQLQTLRAEYSQVLAKGGARSVETDRAASQLIPDGLAPTQLAQVAAQIKIDSDNAIREARNQVSGISGQINGLALGQTIATASAGPQWAPKVLSKSAPDADYEALPSGAHFIGPDGVQRVKP